MTLRPTAGEMEKIPGTLGGTFPVSFSGTLWTPHWFFCFLMPRSTWEKQLGMLQWPDYHILFTDGGWNPSSKPMKMSRLDPKAGLLKDLRKGSVPSPGITEWVGGWRLPGGETHVCHVLAGGRHGMDGQQNGSTQKLLTFPSS